jgi:hypothetical protein
VKFPNPFRFIFAMLRTGYARLRGYRVLTTSREESARWGVCLRCPHRIPGPELLGDQCGVCRCLLDAKVLLTMEECPKRFWKRIWRKPLD